jgi:glycosyltransferase involved in cell wall biosynthesis
MGWYPNDDAMRFFLAEIWPELHRRDPDLRMTIAGRDPTARLVRLAQEAKGVTVTGTVPDILPLLRDASIYVCPLRDGGGTKLKVLEALAAGLPIVATKLAVEGIAVEVDKHYAAAETPAEFVEAILSLRQSPSRRLALGQEGRRLVESLYSWDAIGKRLEDAYRQLESPGRRPSYGTQATKSHQYSVMSKCGDRNTLP